MSDPNPYAEFGQEPAAVRQPAQRADRSLLVLLHLSQLLGYALPMAGFIAPVAIWLVCRDDSPELDAHGRNVVNWIISSAIWWAVVVPLCFVLVGIPLAVILASLCVVFPIVGAVKASNGVVWHYPFTISVF